MTVDKAKTNVLIVNFSGHNYSDATQYGDLVAITDGFVRPDLPDRALNEVVKKISKSTAEDWILPSGLLMLNIFTAIASYHKHGQVKLLLWDRKATPPNSYREVIVTKEQLELMFNHFELTND